MTLSHGDHTRTLTVGGLERTYIVHVPERQPDGERYPLLLAFHGGGSNATGMMAFSGLAEKADQAGFVAVFPNGTGRLPGTLTFNAGNCCGYALKNEIDDVAFVSALLDDLAKVLPYDARRVYATGMSNGGLMSYLLADKLSHRIAAIASVAGPMGTATCAPKHPVPICHIHGDKDDYAPFTGGIGAKSLTKTNFYSVEHSVQNWVRANGCRTTAEVETLPAKIDDGTHVTRTRYTGGKDGAEVLLYTIHGGGHTWPGRENKFPLLGKVSKNLNANDVIWEFVKPHRRAL